MPVMLSRGRVNEYVWELRNYNSKDVPRVKEYYKFDQGYIAYQ